MKKRDSRQPSFDFGPVAVTAPLQSEDRQEDDVIRTVSEGSIPSLAPFVYSTWREVPQARFLSWSIEMQWAYCAARDLDSAKHAENDEWRDFYLTRAASYDS